MKATGKRAVLAVQAALDEAGLGRTSPYRGGEISGWIDRNQFGSTGFSVKKLADGNLSWHVVLSGKPHLRYRKWVERQGDGDTIDLHEPINPESLAPRIKAAFETLGLKVGKVVYAGSQGHWDDDVDYEISTDHPEWLGPPDKSNAFKDGDAPILRSVAIGSRAAEILPPLNGLLVGYVRGGAAYLTRESLMAIDAKAREQEASRQASLARYPAGARGVPRYLREKTIEVSVADSGVLTIKSPRLPEMTIKSEKLGNHWGDEVQVWKVPSSWVVPQASFRPSVPFLLGGEMHTAVPFKVVDAQHGGDVPWRIEEAKAPGPR